MLTRLADLGIRHPRRVLALAGLLLVLAATYGMSAASHLGSGGFNDPHSASSHAADLLQSRFHTGEANLVLEVSAPSGAETGQARATGLALVRAVHTSTYASSISSYWTAPKDQAAGLVSTDGRSALVVATVAGDDSTPPSAPPTSPRRSWGPRTGSR